MKRLTVAGLMMGIMLMMAVWAFGAVVPQVINYSGTLTNKSGAAAPDGTYDIEFNVYSVPTAGTPLWTERWSATATPSSPVLVTGGVFNVMLGAITPFPDEFFANNPNTYLGIKVGVDSEMLPRQKIASVGYAFAAGNGVPKGGIIMWSGVTAPVGWTLCDGSNGTPNLKDRFIIGASATYPIGIPGGSATHTHPGVDHLHYDDHVHHIDYYAVNDPTGPDFDDTVGTDGPDKTPAGSDHRHHIEVDTWGKATGGYSGGADRSLTPAAINTLPPYYALAFIMKL